ncbi:hypothetical protein Dxin01_00136 [Deinococcus xinjiangensis]|uniref:Uncharacterized protein n=1 Tax=Deinococcus xinjiangensis TaxID=457454 RepID=A0ABP9V549_9DEIO
MSQIIVEIGPSIKPEHAGQVVLKAQFIVGDADGTEYRTFTAKLDDQQALTEVYVAHRLYAAYEGHDMNDCWEEAVEQFCGGYTNTLRELWPYDWDAEVYHGLEEFSLVYYAEDGVPHQIKLTSQEGEAAAKKEANIPGHDITESEIEDLIEDELKGMGL